MVEGARLESVYTGNRIEGSNPSPSASLSSCHKTVVYQWFDECFSRYQGSEQLTVAIHVNRQGRFDPSTIAIPALCIAALWIFASMAEDQ